MSDVAWCEIHMDFAVNMASHGEAPQYWCLVGELPTLRPSKKRQLKGWFLPQDWHKHGRKKEARRSINMVMVAAREWLVPHRARSSGRAPPITNKAEYYENYVPPGVPCVVCGCGPVGERMVWHHVLGRDVDMLNVVSMCSRCEKACHRRVRPKPGTEAVVAKYAGLLSLEQRIHAWWAREVRPWKFRQPTRVTIAEG